MICSLKNLNLSNIFNLKFQFITLLISVSVSDRYRPIWKKPISVIYRIGRFKKWHLSVLIGIGRYEKKLIGRTLHYRSKTHFWHTNYAFQQKYVNLSIRNIVEVIKRIFWQKWRNLKKFWNQWDPNPRTSRSDQFTK